MTPEQFKQHMEVLNEIRGDLKGVWILMAFLLLLTSCNG